MKLRTPIFLQTLVVLALATAATPPAEAQEIREILRWLDGGNETLYLRLRQGRWSYQSPRVPTAAWKFSGNITIRAPREGKWRIRLIDMVRPPERGYPPIIDEIVETNQAVPFDYRTGGTAQLRAELTWTRTEDVIAYVDVMWDGCLCVAGSARHPPSKEAALPASRSETPGVAPEPAAGRGGPRSAPTSGG